MPGVVWFSGRNMHGMKEAAIRGTIPADVALRQVTWAASKSWKKWGRILTQQLWREPGPPDTSISDFHQAEP